MISNSDLAARIAADADEARRLVTKAEQLAAELKLAMEIDRLERECEVGPYSTEEGR